MSHFSAVCARNASLKDVRTHRCQSQCGQRTFFVDETVVVALLLHYLVGRGMRGMTAYHLFWTVPLKMQGVVSTVLSQFPGNDNANQK